MIAHINRRRQTSVLLVLLFFTIFGTVRHLSVPGDDLSSSYFGCRVLAAGEPEHLYSRDTRDFSAVSDPVWDAVADADGYTEMGMLHPYVQTPLWAYVLHPLCAGMSFASFNRLFVVILMLSMSGTIWMVTRFWAVRMFHPGWIALVCASLYASEPFKYAIYLNQTHILFMFLTIAALVLAPRGYPVWAGVLLALAAAVKITPGLLFLYWLVTRQTRAAISFAMASGALLGLTVLAVGPGLVEAYFHDVSDISNVLLVAYNNQSFAAWWMGRHFAATELFFWNIYPLSQMVKTLSMLLALAAVVLGGLFDRRVAETKLAEPPYGAVFALLGTMMVTPIAWSHYYVLLVVPILLLLDASHDRRRVWLLAPVAVISALNVYPIAFDAVRQHPMAYSVVRSQFYSGLIALAGISLLGVKQRGQKLSRVY